MTTQTRVCRLGPSVEVTSWRFHENPLFLQPGQTVDLGKTDLCDWLLAALTPIRRRVGITLHETEMFKTLEFVLESVTPGYKHDTINCLVRLVESSYYQVRDRAECQAVVSVNILTGETQLFCERAGTGLVSKTGFEPSFDVSGHPLDKPSWTVHVEFGDKTYRWTCAEGTYKVGQTVRVRVSASGWSLIAL